MPLPELYIMAGPTASGKSAKALDLAQRVNGVIINADAMQIYREVPILTAQPDQNALSAVPHTLYGVFDPAESGSTAQWSALAQQKITETCAAGQIPILVGGTGLYFKTLLDGISNIPITNKEIKAKIKSELDSVGLAGIRAKLANSDPDSYARLSPNDCQRQLRAYEVVLATGKPLGWWHTRSQRSGIRDQYDIKVDVLMPDRAELYRRCDQRFLSMLQQGALDEVRALLARQLDPALPAMKIIGVRELGAYLRDEWSLDEAIAKAQQATRNYAKRQMTWFRNQKLETGS